MRGGALAAGSAAALLLFIAACDGSIDAGERLDDPADASIARDAGSDGGLIDERDASDVEAMPDLSAIDAEDADAEGNKDATMDPPPRPIFVAQGAMGRTIISCDDGASWIEDRSMAAQADPLFCGQEQSAVRCFEPGSICSFVRGGECVESGRAPGTDGPDDEGVGCDCDHNPGSPAGIAWGDNWFVATFGWGAPGEIRRSQDGVRWETVDEGHTYANIAFGNGTFMAGSRAPVASSDGGLTWIEVARADLRDLEGEVVHNVRSLAFASVGGGVFVMTGESGPKRAILTSSDNGASWQNPSLRPDPSRPGKEPLDCVHRVQGTAAGNETIVIAGFMGDLCVSTDEGASFELASLGSAEGDEKIVTAPLFDGARFVLWTNKGNRATSADGVAWTLEPIKPRLSIAKVSYDPASGTYVAVRDGWKNWYEKQEFYRSADGLSWETLAPDRFVGSHPIRHIALGRLPANAPCPSP